MHADGGTRRGSLRRSEACRQGADAARTWPRAVTVESMAVLVLALVLEGCGGQRGCGRQRKEKKSCRTEGAQMESRRGTLAWVALLVLVASCQAQARVRVQGWPGFGGPKRAMT